MEVYGYHGGDDAVARDVRNTDAKSESPKR